MGSSPIYRTSKSFRENRRLFCFTYEESKRVGLEEAVVNQATVWPESGADRTASSRENPVPSTAPNQYNRYRQVLCANSFTSLAELSLHRAGKPALNYLVAEDRERVKGGEAACEALDVNSVFCYQPASSSCISMCFMLMYFFPPHWVPAT